MPYRSITLKKAKHTATVTLSRPETFNAVDDDMAVDLREAFARLAQDDETRVIILTGAAEAFCKGTKLALPSNGQGGIPKESLDRFRVADTIAAVGKPVIAAINGDAISQGLELVLACDIRIAVPEARLALSQVEEGLLPWDGGTQRLPRLVGRGWALYMILTSSFIEARDALTIGLVNEVVDTGDVLNRAKELASLIAQHGPIAAAYVKEAVYKGTDLTLEQGLRLEADLNLLLHSTRDRAEGLRSFMEKRRPEYRGK